MIRLYRPCSLAVAILSATAPLGARAIEPAPGATAGPSARWTLRTADTQLTVGVGADHQGYVYELIDPTGWNWTATPSPIPLVDRLDVDGVSCRPAWKFRDGTREEGDGTFDGIYSGFGSLTKLDGGTQIMNGNNSYTGTTTVSGGKLIVNGLTGPNQGNYTVQANATLGGTGTINLAGGNAVTVLANGILEPGSSAGTMTINGGLNLNNGAILNMELGIGGDKIVVNGQLTGSTGTGGITLNLTPLSGFGDFVLLDWTGGSISGLELTDFNVVGGGEGTLSILGSQLLFSIPAPPAPEPTSFTLLGLGLFTLVRGSRRRRNATIV